MVGARVSTVGIQDGKARQAGVGEDGFTSADLSGMNHPHTIS